MSVGGAPRGTREEVRRVEDGPSVSCRQGQGCTLDIPSSLLRCEVGAINPPISQMEKWELRKGRGLPKGTRSGKLGRPWSGYLTTVPSAAFPRSLPQKLLFPFRDMSGLGVLTQVWIWDELTMESRQGDSFFPSGDSGQEAGPQGS